MKKQRHMLLIVYIFIFKNIDSRISRNLSTPPD